MVDRCAVSFELTDLPFVQSRGTRNNKYSLRRSPVVGYVIHTTGAGPLRRFRSTSERRRFGYTSPMDAALRTYHELMDEGPEFVICGDTGRVVRTGLPYECTWHVGSRGGQPYHSEGWARRCDRWWRARWPLLTSPVELCHGRLWKNDSVNTNTRGVEVVPPQSGATHPWLPATIHSLRWLLHALARFDGVRLSNQTVITHSDAHPLSRTTRSGEPWDPGPTQWNEKVLTQLLA